MHKTKRKRGHKNYYYLPQKHHKAHDFCEFVILQLEELVIDHTYKQLREWNVKFPNGDGMTLQNYDGDVFSFLEGSGRVNELNAIVAGSLINSLLIETSYCLQEAFSCSVRMRLTVAFTLFRKPFSEIVVIFIQLLADPEFLNKFSNQDSFNPVSLQNSKKQEFLTLINVKLLSNLYVVDDLYDLLFNKDFEENIANVGNIATHLYTDRNKLTRTGKQNLNLIFSKKDDINVQWEYIYSNLPMLLTFLADISDLCVMKYTAIPSETFYRRFENRYKMRDKLDLNG